MIFLNRYSLIFTNFTRIFFHASSSPIIYIYDILNYYHSVSITATVIGAVYSIFNAIKFNIIKPSIIVLTRNCVSHVAGERIARNARIIHSKSTCLRCSAYFVVIFPAATNTTTARTSGRGTSLVRLIFTLRRAGRKNGKNGKLFRTIRTRLSVIYRIVEANKTSLRCHEQSYGRGPLPTPRLIRLTRCPRFLNYVAFVR